MADDADRAQAAMEWQLRLALAARRGAGPVGESLACCEACGAAIPEARRRAVPGVRLCVSCQQEAEDAG